MPPNPTGKARAYPRPLSNSAWRCGLESNFPVDKGECSYLVLFNAFKRLAHGASAAGKADLFAGSASRFYRLGI